ncbi:hypothetical protein [Alkanindiges illinoisensis]|uniref:Uncharacterized protein n=1 Tax=Alkanindiges illinoisensis TaxID=197183 RepID=A0A4Y7XDE1_9GAMM|nr:hypothetical protein [Alkanindiges illinoisensis]TEU28662.1 hypothetical protein E2B99_05310 [Alkanindiges illinoisensis]
MFKHKKILNDPLFARINLLLIGIAWTIGFFIAPFILMSNAQPSPPFVMDGLLILVLIVGLAVLWGCLVFYGLYLIWKALVSSDQSLANYSVYDLPTGVDFINLLILLLTILGLGFIAFILTLLIRWFRPHGYSLF